jgi:hypothetical protein
MSLTDRKSQEGRRGAPNEMLVALGKEKHGGGSLSRCFVVNLALRNTPCFRFLRRAFCHEAGGPVAKL